MLNICWVNCRLTVVFLAFDLFFILFCIGMASVVFFSLCCCIPMVAFAYAMTTREGASEEDIRNLPKYTFRQAAVLGMFNRGKEREPIRAMMELDNDHRVKELALHPEDSVSYLSFMSNYYHLYAIFFFERIIYMLSDEYLVDCYDSVESLFSPGESFKSWTFILHILCMLLWMGHFKISKYFAFVLTIKIDWRVYKVTS